jgi:hypothetical protein
MGTPAMSASGLPGSLVEAIRAGIRTSAVGDVLDMILQPEPEYRQGANEAFHRRDARIAFFSKWL